MLDHGEQLPRITMSASGFEFKPQLYRKFPVMLEILDQAGKLLDVSERWLEILGYGREEVVGRPFTDFLSMTTRHFIQPVAVADLFEKGEIHNVECEFVTKDGALLGVAVSATAERDVEGKITHFLLAITDVSLQRRSTKMLQNIAKATATVTGDNYFRTLVTHLTSALGVRTALLTECVDKTMTRVRTLAFIDNHQFLENIEYDLAGTPCERVIQGSVCYYPEGLERAFPQEAGQESYLGVPFYDAKGAILGHLAVLDRKPLHCDSQDMAILEIFAARSGAELECQQRAKALRHSTAELNRLYSQLQDQNRHLEQTVAERTYEIEQRRRVAESLRDMLLILNSNRPLAEILNYVVESAVGLLGAGSGALYILQAETQTLTMQATCGLPADAVEQLSFPFANSFLEQAILQGQPVVVSDLPLTLTRGNGVLDAHRRTILAESYQTLLAIPLLRQNAEAEIQEVYGKIALYYPTSREFTGEEIQLAGAFGAQAALAIENARLRQKVEETAVQEERGRLARELHDSVTQSLYSLTLLSEGWRRMIKTNQLADVENALAELGQISQQALKEMRLLVYELRPPTLEQEGLVGALYHRLNAVEKRAGIEARLISDDLVDLPQPVEDCLYRIAQEALNNALKHAAASITTIFLQRNCNSVTLEVVDNGKGFDANMTSQQKGIGMSSMQERAEKLGGSVTILSAPGQGATVRAQLPLH